MFVMLVVCRRRRSVIFMAAGKSFEQMMESNESFM